MRLPKLVLASLALTVFAVGCGSSSGGGGTPISEQTCQELAQTFADIQQRQEPGQDFDTQSEATKDAGELNKRVDALGGCPDEPSLQ